MQADADRQVGIYGIEFETMTVEEWLDRLPDGTHLRLLKTTSGGLALQEAKQSGQVYMLRLGKEDDEKQQR